jgi:hypothetical protein
VHQPATGCVAGDVELARWALEAWQAASGGNLHFVQAKDKASALLRIVWAGSNDGLYGEAVPILGQWAARVAAQCADSKRDRRTGCCATRSCI